MSTQLTSAELQNLSQILQDYQPAHQALTFLSQTNGNLEHSFNRLWEEKHGNQEFGGTKLWQSS